jgi:16S rRNA (guanine1207-N2)-methyltransferase
MDMASLRQDIRFESTQQGHLLRFQTTWGLFSPREIDSGTDLLLKFITVAPDEKILDLGCGYGPLGITLALSAPQGQVTMVDKDFVAVEYANKNAALNGAGHARALLSNGLAHLPSGLTFTTVVSNIPAKVGKEMMSIFLHDIHQHLEPNGQLVVVTINGLRDYMKRTFTEVFGNYEKVKQGKDYTISRAVKTLD